MIASRLTFFNAVVLGLLLLPHGTARAVTANLQFTANIGGACILTVVNNGILAPNTGFTVLDSAQLGGVPASVTALTTSSGFSFSASTPSSFTLAPLGGNSNVTFATTYSGVGTTIIPPTAGSTATALNFGVTVITVNLAATKSTGIFPAGSYQADVTATCE